MGILLTGISALEYCRFEAHAQPWTHASARCSEAAFPDKPSAKEARALKDRGFGFLSLPVHLLVEDEGRRCRLPDVTCHVRPAGLRCDHVFRVGEGVFVVPPAVCFLQLANDLPFPKLVEAGFELCGRYGKSVGSFEELVSRDPLTSVARLNHFLRSLDRVRGTVAARRAIRFGLDGSMSPMETVNVELLSFSLALGGYGLSLPRMNEIIRVGAKDRPFVKKRYYLCDLYWPKAKFALEYDSNLHHTGAVRIAQDASRRTELAYLGIEVATLTQKQACDRREMDRIARLLAKRLGKRLRMERVNPEGSQDRLRACLLDFSRSGQGNGYVQDW